MMTDPIADMLTRTRNALAARHERVSMPLSRIKREIAQALKEEGYIRDFRVRDELLEIELKYNFPNEKERDKAVDELIKRLENDGMSKSLNEADSRANQFKDISSLPLYFDPDEFSADEIAEIIGLLSELYRDVGGDALVINDIKMYEYSDVAEPVGV